MIARLLLSLLLLLANGFFVAVEFALIASRRTKLEAMAEEGSTGARLAVGVDAAPQPAARRAQLGITMASLLLGFVAEPAVAGLIEDAIDRRRPARAAAAHDRLRRRPDDRRVPAHGHRRDGAEERGHRRPGAHPLSRWPCRTGLRDACSGRCCAS